ncbi:unnamed protein product [Symbiodinium natans]|uniref:Uncharacterized protein n=1 Tax=Symbiodinium natans TaxID=878477 RepID=A0A812TEW0_9DINO|nr:unnamed protein product [Symbiodinium natans]
MRVGLSCDRQVLLHAAGNSSLEASHGFTGQRSAFTTTSFRWVESFMDVWECAVRREALCDHGPLTPQQLQAAPSTRALRGYPTPAFNSAIVEARLKGEGRSPKALLSLASFWFWRRSGNVWTCDSEAIMYMLKQLQRSPDKAAESGFCE